MQPNGSDGLSRRRFLKAVAALGVAPGMAQVVAGGPAAAQAPGGPKRGGKLTVLIHEDLSSIDPFKTAGVGDVLVQGLFSQPLVAGNAKDEIEPVLAESWKSEDDGKTWIFNLRRGVKFHHGREMTAQECKWGFDRILDPKSGAILTSVFKTLGLKSSVVDKYTFKVEIKQGFGAFLSHLTTSTRAAILHPDSVGPDGTLRKPIGTGPFQLIEWKPGAEVQVKRHEEYWQKGEDGKPLPYIEQMTLKIVLDATIRLNALLAGQVDFVTNPPIHAVKAWVDGKLPAGIAFHKWFYNYSDYMSLNTRRPPFKDVRVRQAVRYTLDREALNTAIYFGLGEVHNQPFKKTSHWYLDVPAPKPDLAKARKLMQEAGLAGGVDISMLVWAPVYEKRAEVVQAQLAQIGIRSKLDKRDIANFLKHITTYNWDMATLVIGTIFHPDRPYGYLASDHSAHPYVGGYDSPDLDALLAKARDEADFAKAKVIYKTVLEKYVEEVGTPLYLMNLPLVHAFRDYVKGYSAYGYDLVSINTAMGLHKTWIAK